MSKYDLPFNERESTAIDGGFKAVRSLLSEHNRALELTLIVQRLKAQGCGETEAKGRCVNAFLWGAQNEINPIYSLFPLDTATARLAVIGAHLAHKDLIPFPVYELIGKAQLAHRNYIDRAIQLKRGKE